MSPLKDTSLYKVILLSTYLNDTQSPATKAVKKKRLPTMEHMVPVPKVTRINGKSFLTDNQG